MRWRRGKPKLVCVVSPRNRGWALESIATEVASRYPKPARVVYRTARLPRAPFYFFTHHSLWPTALRSSAWLERRRCAVLFTHPRSLGISDDALGAALAKATVVLSMSSLHVEHLRRIGVPEDRIVVAIPGSDPKRFQPHPRGQGVVGLSSAYYERKSPECLLDVVSAMPHRRFLLVGKGWTAAPVFGALQRLANFEYREAPYEDYPRIYDGMDVFLSVSELEGGPIPLLEAMLSNAVPVATRTGFAPDVISHGENGFLFDVGAPTSQITELVDAAFDLHVDVRSGAERHSYDQFVARLREELED